MLWTRIIWWKVTGCRESLSMPKAQSIHNISNTCMRKNVNIAEVFEVQQLPWIFHSFMWDMIKMWMDAMGAWTCNPGILHIVAPIYKIQILSKTPKMASLTQRKGNETWSINQQFLRCHLAQALNFMEYLTMGLRALWNNQMLCTYIITSHCCIQPVLVPRENYKWIQVLPTHRIAMFTLIPHHRTVGKSPYS